MEMKNPLLSKIAETDKKINSRRGFMTLGELLPEIFGLIKKTLEIKNGQTLPNHKQNQKRRAA